MGSFHSSLARRSLARRAAALLAAAFVLAIAARASAIGIELQTVVSPVTVGSQLEIQIVATGLGDGVAPTLRAWQLDAVFDSTLLAFDSVAFSDALGDMDPMAPLSIGTLIGSPPSSGPVGMAAVSLVGDLPTLDALQQAESLPGGTSALLATLTFEALAVGTGTVEGSNVLAIDNDFLTLPIDSLTPRATRSGIRFPSPLRPPPSRSARR